MCHSREIGSDPVQTTGCAHINVTEPVFGQGSDIVTRQTVGEIEFGKGLLICRRILDDLHASLCRCDPDSSLAVQMQSSNQSRGQVRSDFAEMSLSAAQQAAID